MTTNRILDFLSFSLLAAFIGVVVVFVNKPNLWGVMLLVIGFAFYDFWTTNRSPGKTGTGSEPPGHGNY